MPILIREHPTLVTPINGVAFAVHAAGSISDDMDDELAEHFLAAPLFRLATDEELPDPPETPAQKKAREKAEAAAAAAKEKADKKAAADAEQKLKDEEAAALAEKERLAAEKAEEERLAAEAEAARIAAAAGGAKPEGTESNENVF